MPGATRTVVFNAPIEHCFSVISDYEKYAQFLPEVKRLTTSNRRGDEVDAHYEADLGIQVIKYSVHMKEQRPTRVSWTFIKGDYMRDNKGGWVLEDLGNGTTRATYGLEVAVGPFVPGSILTMLVDRQLPTLLENFRRRIESTRPPA
jgi:coenzyme Q-binding protein COQ10